MPEKRLRVPSQETLSFNLDDWGRMDLLVPGENQRMLKVLSRAVRDRPHELFFIRGPRGCGKSHLLTALFRQVRNPNQNVFFVNLGRVRQLPPRLLEVEPLPVILLDDVDAIAGDGAWELALFGLFNRWLDRGSGPLLAASRLSPDAIPFERHDLNTRFASGVSLTMELLDEPSCAAALKLRAEKRGFAVSDKVANFLVSHCRRNMTDLMETLDELDRAMLQYQHDLTVPFVKKILRL